MQRQMLSIVWIGVSFIFIACDEPQNTDITIGYTGPTNVCAGTADCKDGSICDELSGHCVVEDPPMQKTYYIKVCPPVGAGIPSQVFEVTLPSADTQNLILHEPIPVSLNIKGFQIDNTTPESLDFQVEITRNETQKKDLKIEGASPSISTHTIQFNKDTDLSLPLIPGNNRRYSIKITPINSETKPFGPIYFENLTVTTEGKIAEQDGKKIDLFTVPRSEWQVKGKLMHGDNTAKGLWVIAIDPKTGHQVSSTSMTGSVDNAKIGEIRGEFLIFLSRGITSFSIITSKSDVFWYPLYTTNPFKIVGSSDDSLKTINVGDIKLSSDSMGFPVKYRAKVKKLIKWNNNEPEYYGTEGCRVIFESEQVFGGSTMRSAYTDSNGDIVESGVEGIYLLPASYSVTVIPASSDLFLEDDADIFESKSDIVISSGGNSGKQTFQLSQRSLRSGRVIAQDTGEAIPTAVLSTVPLDGASIYARTGIAQSDSLGNFSVWVDHGENYRLTVEAPYESGYAWKSITESPANKNEKDIELPIPFAGAIKLGLIAASGNLDNEKLLGTTLEVFEEIDGRTFMVGRVAADKNLFATVLLEP